MNTVKRCDSEAIQTLIHWLDHKPELNKSAFVGFDGYVDTIYRAIKSSDSHGQPTYYQTIDEYGNRILHAAGKSADIGIKLFDRRMGGNAPLLADGLAALNVSVDLIGSLGDPELHPCFHSLSDRIHPFSYSPPCKTIALEFNDGKIMMGDMAGNEMTDWQRIESAIGTETLRNRISSASLIAMLNWSAYANLPQIANRVAELTGSTLPLMFFDFSDPNALSSSRLQNCLDTVHEIGKMFPVTIGMNENEARTIIHHSFPEANCHLPLMNLATQYGNALLQRLHLEQLTIHTVTYALGFDGTNIWYSDGFTVEKPMISTGGGDHYNAAFCFGMIYGLPLSHCLLLSNAASSYFVVNGKSATLQDIKNILERKIHHSSYP